LRALGLSHLEPVFAEHEVGPNEIAHLKENHLIDMGVTNIGDRLRIIESTQAFLRGERNRRRQKDILVFSGWTCKFTQDDTTWIRFHARLTMLSQYFHVRNGSLHITMSPNRK
jgi:hypothetical protein